jgi:hypothetical protein
VPAQRDQQEGSDLIVESERIGLADGEEARAASLAFFQERDGLAAGQAEHEPRPMTAW